jgi:glutamine synthetase
MINGLFYPASNDNITEPLTYTNGHQSMKFVPDKESLRVLPWAPKQGIVFCKFANNDNTPFSGCPRSRLE